MLSTNPRKYDLTIITVHQSQSVLIANRMKMCSHGKHIKIVPALLNARQVKSIEIHFLSAAMNKSFLWCVFANIIINNKIQTKSIRKALQTRLERNESISLFTCARSIRSTIISSKLKYCVGKCLEQYYCIYLPKELANRLHHYLQEKYNIISDVAQRPLDNEQCSALVPMKNYKLIEGTRALARKKKKNVNFPFLRYWNSRR